MEKEANLFDFQLEMLKTEINHIQEIIGRIDEITQQIKNWAILIWAGSISLIVGNSNINLRKLIFVSVIIPFLFWIVDGHFRRRQRRFLFRTKKISEYLNSDNFSKSFQEKRLKNFVLLDPLGKQYPSKDIQVFSSVRRAMWFKSMRAFYLGLIITTIILQIVLYPYSNDRPPSKSFNEIKDSIIITNQDKIIQNLLEIVKKDSVHVKQ